MKFDGSVHVHLVCGSLINRHYQMGVKVGEGGDSIKLRCSIQDFSNTRPHSSNANTSQ